MSRWQALAAAERDGKPVLPLLRQVCEVRLSGSYHTNLTSEDIHYPKGCPGYVVKDPDLELLITALEGAGLGVFRTYRDRKPPILSVWGVSAKRRPGTFLSSSEGTDLERLSGVACEALGLEIAETRVDA